MRKGRAPKAAEPPRGDSFAVAVPDATRGALIAALALMPDEAFSWFALACQPSAMVASRGRPAALTQIWPDGLGGFSSRESIEAVRAAADAWLAGRGLKDGAETTEDNKGAS